VAGSTPEVLTDPVAVIVDLVAGLAPGLGRAGITEIVVGVGGGRVKRRRLAQALLDRPAVLTDGRSPAPRIVGDLLIALRNADVMSVSAPVCTECGKALRTLQRRGQDWYCGACGPKPEPCADCGKVRPVCVRDREQRPHCVACRPKVDQDPAKTLLGIVAELEPDLASESITRAVLAAAPRTGQRQRLAWALQDDPELLTGAGARAPVPAVLRLIGSLADAGAQHIVRPACPHCQRTITLVKRLEGTWLCRNCVAKSRAVTCSRCGAHREAAARDEHGEPLCPHCLITDPVNLETCTGCRRRRPVSVRTPGGPLCGSCRPVATMTCSICGRLAPAVISKLTGQPCCHACLQRRARCTGCGVVKPIRSGTPTEPRCATCTRPDASWHACHGCGETTQHRSRRCARCSMQQRLGELLRDSTGAIHPQLQVLHDNLANHDRPDTVLAWLNKEATTTVLRGLAVGQHPLTHAGLDELPDAKPLRHLRSVLVATGALPPRDEQLIRLERWITTTIAAHPDQQLLHRYAIWHVLRRLRQRNNAKHLSYSQHVGALQHVRAAITLLDWLTSHGLTLATARQGDLDTWLTSEDSKHRREAGHFVRWARGQKLTGLDFAATKWDGPAGDFDTEIRWQQARRLLHDDSINTADRVAGLLVLLYAQWPATIARLTLEHVHDDEHQVRLRLGREPIVLPEPLAELVLHLVASRHGHATLGDQGTSPWLFPGGRPDWPISAEQLGERLRQIGLRPGQDRSGALFALATELPAALLARLLGIHISVAVAWQRASSGDWTNYAANYSRRQHTPNELAEGTDDHLS
jgi:hypothetical protein